MTEKEFWYFARDLAAYFGSEKHLKPTDAGKEQLKKWFYQIQNMSSNGLQLISDSIKATCDYMPKNLPKIMWQYDNEVHKASINNGREQQECDCEGGTILVWHREEWVAVRCLRCMPPLSDTFIRADVAGKKKYGVWQSTLNDLLRQGYTVFGGKNPKENINRENILQHATQGKSVIKEGA